MDFLDNFVLPQSSHHMVLLKYLLVLTYLILFPYLSALFGSLIFSLYFKNRGEKANNKSNQQTAKRLIDLVTFNKSVSFGMGLVPMLSAAFCYAQLLHLTPVIVPGFIIISMLLLFVAIIIIYSYKYTYHLKEIFSGVKESGSSYEFVKYSNSTSKINSSTGIWGLLVLSVSIYLFLASVQFASDYNNWLNGNNFLNIVFSLDALFAFFLFVLLSVGLTSTINLYMINRNSSSDDEKEYSEEFRIFAASSGLIASIILPAIIIATVLLKPASSLNYSYFILVVISILLILAISIMYYRIIKEGKRGLSVQALFLFFILFFVLIIKEQYAFDTATKYHFELLSANYENYTTKLKEEMGVSTVTISGADIFNGRCIACHAFDKRIVGPPYNDVLPKYVGKEDALAKFILNPVKINPEYTAMPNQGLKPNEADAIAQYLLSTYKK